MVLNNIENLLEKYEKGETTLQEEAQLKDYFSQDTVAPHLEYYKAIFAYYVVNQQETFTKNVPLNTKKKINFKWLSVAAVAVLMVGIYFNLPKQDTITEADRLAYNQAKSYLSLVSQTLNKGKAQVNYLDAITKAGTQVDYLKQMESPIQRTIKK
ncbi:hypothetical protein [Olleya marilimosa]|uniref:Uncharacterized protein n=1 Tax=Olleya marilimosa TaxID=272164 RepID=A0ABR8LQ76_9FLAO|nr:hypothetical protein [Olleya marilimosa]MBD3862369.1 hypothetical protein [Olleya marilimosa]MBD3889867.1 hypothetical protein [Olleya marilimosa]